MLLVAYWMGNLLSRKQVPPGSGWRGYLYSQAMTAICLVEQNQMVVSKEG
jgi:hypothetical protein